MKPVRRSSRGHALQVLYQLDIQKSLGHESGLDYFRTHFLTGSYDFEFAKRLVVGVSTHLAAIDQKIGEAATHWRVDRMSVVDRNIMRMGVFELCHCADIPATVTINEMVELAKEFGEDGSSAFVNAVLDKVRVNHPVAEKAP